MQCQSRADPQAVATPTSVPPAPMSRSTPTIWIPPLDVLWKTVTSSARKYLRRTVKENPESSKEPAKMDPGEKRATALPQRYCRLDDERLRSID